jgi:hypothetical protein
VAIKGKGKTKSRPQARAPRRAPVEVPTPILRRRWVQLTAALLLGAGIVWFLIWLTNGIRQSGEEEREAAAQVERRRAVQGWKELVEAQLATVGTLGAAGAPPTVATELGPAVEELAEGDGDVAALEDLEERLSSAAGELEAFELGPAIRGKGFDVGEASALTDSQERLAAALRIYAAAARVAVAVAAAEVPQADREAVLDEARVLSDLAGSTLADAWSAYVIGLQAAGLTPADAGAGIPGLDTPGVPIGG